MNPRSTRPLLSRRELLLAGGMSMFSLGMPGIVMARDSAMGGLGGRQKSCIFILLCGGASHLDTWDLKPDAPAEIRGPYKPIETTVPGMRLSELHPKLAKLGKHLAVIHSMNHPGAISNHFDAMHNCLSGSETPGADAPYMGSLLAKYRPSQTAMASYVWLIKCVGDPVFCAPNLGTGGSLGAAYAPLFVGNAENNPASPKFQPPDVFSPTEATRMAGRRELLDTLDRPATGSVRQWQDLHRKAFEMTARAEARRAFEIDREDVKVRDRYGRHPLGQNLLLARRLVEAGVGFVTVNGWTGRAPNDKGGGPPSSSWDMHGAEMGMGNAFGAGSYGMGYCLPCLDEAVSALLQDLEERGRLDSTLVVVCTEFGRTPRINQNNGIPGRQHWPACFSAILAGGGIRGGQVYGESDKTGSYVKDRPVRPSDFAATIYTALGVPLDPRLSKDGVTKPLTTGKPVLGLLA
jgi:uncharacterized protein (DUF1501 family)